MKICWIFCFLSVGAKYFIEILEEFQECVRVAGPLVLPGFLVLKVVTAAAS